MSKFHFSFVVAGMLAAGLAGCNTDAGAPAAEKENSDSSYLVSSEPSGAVGVGEARESAKDGQEVVLVGRIGGSVEPFVDGLAAFTIVDPMVASCLGEEENCPTPWDYCCTQDEVKENIATVKIVDAEGHPVAQDARELLGVKELTMVVARGTAERDAKGNLSLTAHQIYVKE